MKKIFIVISVCIIFVGSILTVFLNSNYYYSKKLVSAIREENIIAVRQIIGKKPTCINTYPSIVPKWWRSLMDYGRVCYALNEACATGNIELVELLIKNGADVNCNDGLTPLSITYSIKVYNWYDISLILIENGASLEYVTDYSGGNSSVFQDIVKARSVVSLPEYEPESNKEVIEAFNYALENCDHSNVNWMRVLQHSVSNTRIEIVKLLLDQKYCDVNDTSVGMTALMFAARDSTFEMVQFLLDYGADKNIKCSDAKTAYYYAVQSNNKDIMAILES